MSSPMLTIRRTTNEVFGIQCGRNLLSPNGAVIATIQTVDTIRLEQRVSSDPVEWSEKLAAAGFTGVRVLSDPDTAYSSDMIAGRLSIGAGPHDVEAEYRIVAECTIALDDSVGGGTETKNMVLDARIASSLSTTPSS